MRHAFRVSLVALGAAVLSTSAMAQVPGAATPVPAGGAKGGAAAAGALGGTAAGAAGGASAAGALGGTAAGAAGGASAAGAQGGSTAGAAGGASAAGVQGGSTAGAAGGASAGGAQGGSTAGAAAGARGATGTGAGGPKAPDLVVTIGPGNPFPASFTVKNAGTADAGASILKVTATLLPLEKPAVDKSCPPAYANLCEARAALAASVTPERAQSMCGDPFADVLDAIPALKVGESKTISRDTTRFTNVRITTSTGSPPGTHIQQGVTTLVCAFDVVAQADFSNQVAESHEDNNSATLRVFREIRLE